MLKKSFVPSVLLMMVSGLAAADKPISLSGKWQFQLGLPAADKTYAPPAEDENIPGIFSDTIDIPGTTDTNRKGIKTTGSTEGTYTRRYKHIGSAWYQRQLDIPKSWNGKDVELFIERALWKTTVYLDCLKQGEHDSLATPHVYNLGKLNAGKHTLTICVDNSMIYNIGDKSHSYSENMQTIWNGMVGKIELRAQNNLSIMAVRSIVNDKDSHLLIAINNCKTVPQQCSITLDLSGKSQKETITIDDDLQAGTNNILLPLPNTLVRWDEFNPYLYDAKITIDADKEKTLWQGKLGFCQPGKNETYITINGRPTFLRGNLDNCHFPLTGYPPCDKAAWLRIWKIYKDFGLNNVRFHSWCPPEAAFAAADEAGIYIQVEAGVWIDSWMKKRVASVPQGISDQNIPVRDFVAHEMKRIVDAYGHHPSFIMFCIGNELGSSDFKTLAELVNQTRQYDRSSRLYSCSTARVLQPETEDYFVSHENSAGPMRGLHGPKTNWTYDSVKAGAPDTPLILHELGQWPIWPRWNELKKYNGVVEPRNLEAFKALSKENNLLPYDDEFQVATGKFSVLLYKAEMEAALRTKSYSGFHMLGLQDYMGQGEALIGILDMFYDPKPGIISPKEYRRFCAPVVCLAEFEKYAWNSGETFSASLKVSNFSATDISAVSWILAEQNGNPISQGVIKHNISQGTVTDLGTITANLVTDKPLACTLQVSIDKTSYTNSWPIWIYPEQEIKTCDTVLISERLDEKTIEALNSGRNVLLMASDCLSQNNSQKNNFMPVYWSVGWFPGQDATLGLTCDPKHPLFQNFPTANHCDWQWYDIVNESEAMIVDDLPAGYRPIVEPIDDFHLTRRLAAIFETKVGKGKLLVCAYPLQKRLQSSACSQLYSALLTYAASNDFSPKTQLPLEWLKKNLSPHPSAITVDQKAFGSMKPALWVQVADMAAQADKEFPYTAALDVIKTKETGFDYQLTGDGVITDVSGAFIFGKALKLEISVPRGLEGTVYVRFNDSDNANRSGQLIFENRPYVLGEHSAKEGRWLQFDTMREDALDSMLVLNAESVTGPNLKIDEFIFIPD